MQYADDRQLRFAPREILSPGSWVQFCRLGLPEPRDAITCEGVLSSWGEGEPDYYDYRLMTGSPGVAIERERFHAALGHAARMAGVIRRPRQGAASWRPGLGANPPAPYQVVACGRSGACGCDERDRLVALFVPCRGARSDNRLLIEAVSDGWWYLPPGLGRSPLVFVTDPSLVPRGKGARTEWLSCNLTNVRMIACAACSPAFDRVRGIDARVGRAVAIDWHGGCRLGDAALSLDPLSRTGIARALEGAEALLGDLLALGAAGPGYLDWVVHTHTRETAIRNSRNYPLPLPAGCFDGRGAVRRVWRG